MTMNEAKKSLVINNLNERLMENLLQAKTEEERGAILQETGVVPVRDNLTELNDEELSRVAGGNTQTKYNMRCQVCGIIYNGLTWERAREKSEKHMEETGHHNYQVY